MAPDDCPAKRALFCDRLPVAELVIRRRGRQLAHPATDGTSI
jgi:hypothetical protein